MKKIFMNWYEIDISENNTKYTNLSKPPFKKYSIDENDDREMTFEEFKTLNLEDQF